MDLLRLKWAAIFIPIVFLSAVDYARLRLWPGLLHNAWGYLAVGAMVSAFVYVFAEQMFRRIEDLGGRLARQNRALAGLHTVAQTLGQPLDLDSLLQRALEQVLLLSGADRAELLLLEEGSPPALVLRGRVGAPLAPGGAGARFDPAAGVRGFAAMPLRAGDRWLGALHLGAPRPFPPELVEVLAAVGAQLGLAVGARAVTRPAAPPGASGSAHPTPPGSR